MVNRGYPDRDGRFGDGGEHSTGARKDVADVDVEGLVGLTSVAEQYARGGWSRAELPCSDDPVNLPVSKYRGGTAGGRRADYPGTSTPAPGVTY